MACVSAQGKENSVKKAKTCPHYDATHKKNKP